MNKCKGFTKNGKPCRMPAGADGWCFNHRPGTEAEAERQTARSIGGKVGTLRIAVPVTISKQAAPGEVTLQGELRYQACFELRCSATRTLPVKLTIDVLPARPA